MMPEIALLAQACLVLLAFGALLVLVLAVVPATAATARDALPILLTEVVIVGVAVGALWAGGWILTAALLLHAARTGYEAARVRLPDESPWPALGFGIGLAALGWLGSVYLSEVFAANVAMLALFALIGALVLAFSDPRTSPAAAWLDIVLFPGLPLIVFTAAGLRGEAALLLAAFLLVETFDSYALLGGKLFGRRKAFPQISPGKTIEGLIAGAVMLVFTAVLLGPALGVPVTMAAAAALAAGSFSVAGDLCASRLKRIAGVKDYPRIMPYQGGLLDITDAWIATTIGFLALSGAF
ncbi:phosphatidate cytidylyltransferase [Pseudoruegeria sp. HB172150]|uniref:phosphatidate cytidylyltransferase n=1 Tax=Pseudoruegeria sp. HB172150 TaxID=2721164 RepID=UPI0015578BAC|nr:phosphatidate cytidylyltransferase [Pseudoruegeria sp. HB172150]